MNLPTHRNYIIAARLSLFLIVINIIPPLLSLKALKGNTLLSSNVTDDFYSLIIRGLMISLLVGIVLALLIWMGYNWMKWVKLVLALFSGFGLLDILETFSESFTAGFIRIISLTVNVVIIMLLFKIPKQTEIPLIDELKGSPDN